MPMAIQRLPQSWMKQPPWQKCYCSDTFFFNGGNAIQLYGGVGFTWEYDLHLYFKRAKASELFLGNGAQQRELIAQMLLD